MFKNYLQLMLRLSIFVFSLSAFSQAVSYSPPAHYRTVELMNPIVTNQTGGLYGQVSLFAGAGTPEGSDNSNPLNATLGNVRRMAKDAKGNYYVAESGNGKIRKISPFEVVTTIFYNSSEFYAQIRDLAINTSTGTIYFIANSGIYHLNNTNNNPLVAII